MIEYAQWTGIIVAFINMIITIIDKKISKLFRVRGATTPKAAISIETLNLLLRWRLKRMRYSGFVQDKKSNKYYFDECVHKAKRKTRLFRVLIFMILAIVIVLSIVLVTN